MPRRNVAPEAEASIPVIEIMAHPTGFEPVTSAFGVQSFHTMRDKLKH